MHYAAFLFALLPVLQAGSPGAESPFVGTWTASLSKLKVDPNHQLQSASLQFAVAGDTVRIADGVVDASGAEEGHGATTFQTDDKEHPSEQAPGVVVVARWVSSHILETIAKRDGQVVGRGTYEVSADGRTLTARVSGRERLQFSMIAGFGQTIVFVRK
jgi:hypothetical protein